MRKIWMVMILVLLALAASGAEEEAQLEKELKAEVLKVVRESEAEWNNGSIEGYLEVYWKSPDMRFVQDTSATFGWQTHLDGFLKAFPDSAAMGHQVFSDLDITILTPEWALVFGAWRVEREQKSSRQGMFTWLLHLFDEGWRVVHDHSSF